MRLQDHIGEARRGKSASVLHVEMRRAIAAGLPIRIEPLQEVDEERAYQAEGEWAGYLDTLWPAGLNSPAPGMRARRHVDMLVVPVPSISPEHLLPCIRTLFADVQAHGNRDAAGALHCAGAPGAGDQ